MVGILIQRGDIEPPPASISNYLPLRIPLAEKIKDIPELVAATCRYVKIQNIEDVSISKVGSIICVGVQFFLSDVVIFQNEVILRRRDGVSQALLSLAPIVLIAIMALQVLWVLIVIEYTNPYLLTNILVTQLRKVCTHDGGYLGWAHQGIGSQIVWVHQMHLGIGRCRLVGIS